MRASRPEAGFTLVEVLIATGLFVVVALTGFEAVRQLGWSANALATRADAAAQANVATGALRSAALSSAAVWRPASDCGDAVEFLERSAAGAMFLLYTVRDGELVRATSAAPMNPCDAGLQTQSVIAHVAGLHVVRVAANALAAHTDPVSGNADGAIFAGATVTEVAVDAHVTDTDGSPIVTGNDVIEVTIDTDPVDVPIDLVAGNRPSAYTAVLTYTCNGRCEANGPFPELRNAAHAGCTAGYDFSDSPAYYVPAAFGTIDAGNGNRRLVVTAYTVTGGFTFAFGGGAPLTAERAWSAARWPPAGSALDGTVADPYPLDYANNAVHVRGAPQVAADLGENTVYAAELTACADMQGDATFAG